MIYWELTRIIAMDVNQLIPRIITHASWDWRCICGGATEHKICSLCLSQKRNIKMQTGRVLLKPYLFAMLLVNPRECQKKKGF